MSEAAVVVPLRGRGGKSRLAPVLRDDERDALVVGLARHVLDVALRAPGVGRVLLVTADPGFADIVAPAGVEVLAQRRTQPIPGQPAFVEEPLAGSRVEAGLNAGVDEARAHLPPHAPIVVLHADLPVLAPADVAALLRAAAPVALAPDAAGRGTNAVALARADLPFRTRFGPRSTPAHLAEAQRHGLPVALVDTPGLCQDLDDPADWAGLPVDAREGLRLAVSDRPGSPGPGTRIPADRTAKGHT